MAAVERLEGKINNTTLNIGSQNISRDLLKVTSVFLYLEK